LGGTLFVVWQRRPPGRPLVVGHRGASALESENSLAAFRRAASDGADGVELDVLRCATGEVLVFHDDDLARLGGRPERVAELPYAALRELELTSGARIPTLQEALAACGPTMLVNVELKTGRGLLGGPLGALVDGVAGIVEATGTASRVLISSFHPRAIHLWQRRAPAVPAGLLFEAGAALPLRRAWARAWLSPFALHPESALCTLAAVRGWHAAGYAVNVWTVDEPERLRALRDMGVDGIITNDPARARAVLEEAPRATHAPEVSAGESRR
jgi:glycerophosphoryl diester phosphodiesterase